MKRETKLLIEKVMNYETGIYVNAKEFFNKPLDEIHYYRSELDKAIKNKRTKLFICPICKQLIRIRGGLTMTGEKKKIGFHFAHLADTSECPIKTNYHLTQEETNRILYNGVKESLLHIELKNMIAECLRINQESKGGFSDIHIERVVKSGVFDKEWRKPDVQSIYKNNKVVFELQISTTWLSVITERQEFYKENEIFILWIFDKFDINDDTRKLTYNDVIYTNKQNAYVFDSEMFNKSLEIKDLVLRVFYNTFYLDGIEIRNNWKNKVVSFSELKFDIDNYKIYYFDSDTDKRKCLEKLDLLRIEEHNRKIEQKNEIEAENKKRSDRLYFLDYKISKYKNKIENINKFDLPDINKELAKIKNEQQKFDDILEDVDSFFQTLLKVDYLNSVSFSNKFTLEQELKEINKDLLDSYKQLSAKIQEGNNEISKRLEFIQNIEKLPQKIIENKNYGILDPKDIRQLDFIKSQNKEIKIINKKESDQNLFSKNYIEPLINKFPNFDGLPHNSFINNYFIIFSFEQRVLEHKSYIDFLNNELQKTENEMLNIKKQIIKQIDDYIKNQNALIGAQKVQKLLDKGKLEKKLDEKKKKLDSTLNEYNNLDSILNSSKGKG